MPDKRKNTKSKKKTLNKGLKGLKEARDPFFGLREASRFMAKQNKAASKSKRKKK